MRSGYNDEKFSRPIKWIVSVLDKDEVKIKIIDKESSIYSRGHRFSEQKVLIENPKNYLDTMRKVYVIADQNERKQIIVEKAREELGEAMKDRKVHEKLKEKAFDEFKLELNDQEKKEIDEVVSFNYNDNNKNK